MLKQYWAKNKSTIIIYLMLTKYGNLKFGGDDTEPEFSKLQWFGMMYTCGVAVGLFFFGVAEPMWHFHGWGGARCTPIRHRRAVVICTARWALIGCRSAAMQCSTLRVWCTCLRDWRVP